MSGDFSASFDFPYYTGTSGVSRLVPSAYPVAVAGRPYLIDTDQNEYTNQWLHQSIANQRTAISDGETGEDSLNPEALLRRSQSSWQKGAGQRHYDRPNSDPERFWRSLGVDVWDRWQLTLLSDVDRLVAADITPGLLTTCDGFLFVTDGPTTLLRYGPTLTSPSTATVPHNVVSLTSDGATVYAATGSGIYSLVADPLGSATLWQTGAFTACSYVKSRLIAASGGDLFDIRVPSSTVAQTPIFTHPNPNWTWDCFAEGDLAIYAAGHAGDYSAIYRIFINDDGSDLAAPIVAASLPRGETVTALLGYLGFAVIGTTKGVRLATIDSSGSLTVGAVIETGQPVTCLTPDSRFVWYGWTDYDPQHTGLGRLDLTVINDNAPAYATDLMANSQGTIQSAVRYAGKTLFTVASQGLFCEADRLVAAGALESGLVTFDVAEEKVAYYVKVSHTQPLVGGYRVELAADEGLFALIGTRLAGVDDTIIDAKQTRGETMETRLTLLRSTSDSDKGPTVRRVTLMGLAATQSGSYHILPLRLTENPVDLNGKIGRRDVLADYLFLTRLRARKTLVTVQEGSESYLAVLDDYEFRPKQVTEISNQGQRWFSGTFVAKFKTFDIL